MDYERKLRELCEGNRQFADFAEYVRKVATKSLAVGSVFDRVRKIDILNRKYDMDLEDPDIAEVIGRVEESGAAATTVNAYRFVLKQWIQFKQIDLTKPDKKMLKNKQGDKKRKIKPRDLLTAEEREYMYGKIQSPSMRGYLAALWDTGARPSELARMNVSDVVEDKHGYVLNVHQRKYEKKKRSIRMIDPRSIAVFSDWWRIHPHKDDPDSPLFLNRNGDRFTPSSVGKYLKRKFNDAFNRGEGRPKCNLFLYLFRKSRATQLVKEGKLNDMEIRMRMGHKRNSTVLEEFYAILDQEDQAEAELKYLGVRPEEEDGTKIDLCPSCGAPYNEGDRLCPRCRHPLTEEALLEQRQQTMKEVMEGPIRDALRKMIRAELEEEG